MLDESPLSHRPVAMNQGTQPTGGAIRVGDFVVDPRSGELRGEAGRQVLSAQPLHVLVTLAERPGELVTRDELRARLWPADTYVDFEHGLNAVVKRLRDALGDSADAPRYIETVPRRGYRLVARGSARRRACSRSSRARAGRTPEQAATAAADACRIGVRLGPPPGPSPRCSPVESRSPRLACSSTSTSSDRGPRRPGSKEACRRQACSRRGSRSVPDSRPTPAWSPDGRRIAFACRSRRQLRPVHAERGRWRAGPHHELARERDAAGLVARRRAAGLPIGRGRRRAVHGAASTAAPSDASRTGVPRRLDARRARHRVRRAPAAEAVLRRAGRRRRAAARSPAGPAVEWRLDVVQPCIRTAGSACSASTPNLAMASMSRIADHRRLRSVTSGIADTRRAGQFAGAGSLEQGGRCGVHRGTVRRRADHLARARRPGRRRRGGRRCR